MKKIPQWIKDIPHKDDGVPHWLDNHKTDMKKYPARAYDERCLRCIAERAWKEGFAAFVQAVEDFPWEKVKDKKFLRNRIIDARAKETRTHDV